MSKKIKIIHIVEAFGGGIYSMLVDLLNSTIDEMDITVIYALRPQTPDNFEKDFDSRIKFIHSKYLTRNIGLNDIKAFLEVKKIIKKEKPDIVHCHSSKAGIIGRFATNTKKVKTFYTPHGYSFLMQDNSKIKRIIYKLIERIASLNYSTIIACSEAEFEEASKISKRATYINNGINLNKIEKYIPDKVKKIDKDNLKVVTTGRITYAKNPTLFNRIAEINKNIQFTWVGQGELFNTLKSKNIFITGWKEKNELYNFINLSDVFMMTSLWEGLPLSLLEAMALKKICIVSNIGACNHIITNGVNGFICNNLNDYNNILKDIKNNKYDLEKIANKASNDIYDKYNTDIMVKKYIEIYKF